MQETAVYFMGEVRLMTKRGVTILAVFALLLAPLAAQDPFTEFPNALGMFGNTLSGNPGGGLL